MRIRQHRVAVVVLSVLIGVAGAAPAASAASARAAGAQSASAVSVTTHTPVMGPSLLSAAQLAAWYNHVQGGALPNVPTVHNNIGTLASLFIQQGNLTGVRGDIAFVQSIIETGWFMFPSYGQIRPWFNNFAGLYAFDGRANGTTCAAEAAPSRCFASPAIGIRTQIDLLHGYADATTRNQPGLLARPPSDRIGVAPIWELFGGASGKAIWATSPTYGIDIIRLYSEALVFNGANAACLPYYPGSTLNQSGTGYWVAQSDGGVQSFGAAHFYGSAGNLRLNKPVIGSDATTNGYWLVATDGGIFNYGAARFYGSTGNIRLVAPVLGMSRTIDSRGYWLSAFDGGVFSYGDARFFGSMGGKHLNQPVLGMARTGSGRGYWLVAADGGIFSFGDARFYGSLGATHIPAPIVSMQPTSSGHGYWMLGADGRVYPFGDAGNFGGVAGCGFGSTARLLPSPSNHGYWIEARSGTVIALGDARRLGFPAVITGTAVGLMG
jgi:hypothetical protein